MPFTFKDDLGTHTFRTKSQARKKQISNIRKIFGHGSFADTVVRRSKVKRTPSKKKKTKRTSIFDY